MSSFRAHRRATALLFALTLVAVASKGVCMMPGAVAAGNDTHACSAKSTETIAAGCCMDGQDDAAPATTTVRAPAPGPETLSPIGAVAAFVPPPRFAFDTHRHHPPPPHPVLRV